mmetsp:Transcript_10716/g.14694  ORF Transcript_10716/g.14694 Transcript_10716/m.14694 type:complete len:184 (-) Transcript_10716:92-643(-)
MVIHVNLGGRVNEFDPKTLNVKHVFGPYAVLLDKHMKPVPLKPSGEPLEPLRDNETFTVQLSGLGSQGSSVIAKAKKQQQIQTEKAMASRVVSLSPQPPNLVVTEKAKKKIEKRSRKPKQVTEDLDCSCDCGCFDWFSSKSRKSPKKDKYGWTPLTLSQEDSEKPTRDHSMKEIERTISAALN